jgi:hypothetical protein
VAAIHSVVATLSARTFSTHTERSNDAVLNELVEQMRRAGNQLNRNGADNLGTADSTNTCQHSRVNPSVA